MERPTSEKGPGSRLDRLRRLAGEILANQDAWMPGPGDDDPSRVRVPRRLGRYRLTQELQWEGPGLLFEAEDPRRGTLHHLRVLVAGEHASAKSILRLRKCRDLLLSLGRQPNVIGMHDLGRIGRLCYYTASLFEQRTIASESYQGRMRLEKAVPLIEEVARFLHVAHAHGVVHGDLRPVTIYLDKPPHPRLMDLGLVRRASERVKYAKEDGADLSYMAPEQLGKGEIDGRADVYALGGILYSLCCGNAPHSGGSLKGTRRSIDDPERLARGMEFMKVPPDVRTILMNCLGVLPEERYPTAGELAEDLARHRSGKPVKSHRPIWGKRLLRRWKRSWSTRRRS